MKKYFLILIALISFMGLSLEDSSAQSVSRFHLYKFAIKYSWQDWEAVPWESCNLTLSVNADAGIVHINSKTPQTYHIIDIVYLKDNDTKFLVKDSSGGRAHLRICETYYGSGEWQCYVNYNDVNIVYMLRPYSY